MGLGSLLETAATTTTTTTKLKFLNFLFKGSDPEKHYRT